MDWQQVVGDALRYQQRQDEEQYIETDPYTFHPHRAGMCKRQLLLSKLGLLKQDIETLGRFKVGELIHDWIEETTPQVINEVNPAFELSSAIRDRKVTWTGRTDCLYEYNGYTVITDFKSRSGWYNFDPPSELNKAQLLVYMQMFDADYGQIVYISKKDMEVREWPDVREYDDIEMRIENLYEFSKADYEMLYTKVAAVGNWIDEHGIPSSPEEIPFEKCGCWLCEKEELDYTEFQ